MGSIYYSDYVTNRRVQRKIQMFGNSQNTILSLVCQSDISIRWPQEIFQRLDGDYSECAMKIAVVAWVGHRAGM